MFLDEYVDVVNEVEVPDFVVEHDRLLEEHPLLDYGFQLDRVAARAHAAEMIQTHDVDYDDSKTR